ncbi:transcriptional regulator [Marinitenerispora sediminis]|uniref:Transcriptional regulator n=2 Tax=Marinitenerispora sediminis TaxID=1931232 RepID=A0A368TAN6_9ACTN|nr:transcriptional regulator [Marinitenerispora sediminis]RCV52670.1 transcriptional regulator [Marinitenerispora sediminis]RCV62086.1 transcriptional regulator [Marinitenerispora sediminis]
MWEIVLSLYMLAEASDELVFGQWRQRVLSQLPPNARMLLDLVPAVGYSPDFLSPILAGHDLSDGIDGVLGTPRARIGDELGLRFGDARRPAWTMGLLRKESASVRALGHALRDYFDVALRPYWGYISHLAQRTSRSVAEGGTGPAAAIAQAATRGPRLTTVELAFGADQDLHLGGRGLLLIPAFFCATNPVTFYDPSLPPVVMYPVDHPPVSFLARATESGRPSGDVLARLLGRTRAAVLRTLTSAHTTGELARTLDISLPSASEHTSLLRAAGLVSSERRGNSVRHHLTPLGLELLHPAH